MSQRAAVLNCLCFLHTYVTGSTAKLPGEKETFNITFQNECDYYLLF